MGDNLEDRWGHFQYLCFYLFSGIIAAMFYGFFTSGYAKTIPSIGASGAISGVLGAYLILFPKSKITFWYLFIFFRFYTGTFEIFSYLWISLWFIQQIIGMAVNINSEAAGVAFGAHVGGFLAGMGIAFLVRLVQQTRYISAVKAGKNILYEIAGKSGIRIMPFEDQIELFNLENQIRQLIQQGDLEHAAILYGNGLKKFEDINIGRSLEYKFAEILQQHGLSDEAIIAYRRFLRNNPFSERADDALYNLGILYRDKGEKEKAKNCFRQIVLFYPYSELNNAARYALSNIK